MDSFVLKTLLTCLFVLNVQAENFDNMVDRLLKETVPQISPKELSIKISEAKPPLLLDTREKSEYEVSHLEGALYIGYKKADFSRLHKLDKDTPIVTYCSIGKRSEEIGEKLIQLGFTNVKNLRGGIFQWANEKRPYVNLEGGHSTSVHPYNLLWGKWLKDHITKAKK